MSAGSLVTWQVRTSAGMVCMKYSIPCIGQVDKHHACLSDIMCFSKSELHSRKPQVTGRATVITIVAIWVDPALEYVSMMIWMRDTSMASISPYGTWPANSYGLKMIWTGRWTEGKGRAHYNDIIMSTMASQITSISIICSAICSGTDQRKYQSFVSLAFVRRIHWWQVVALTKGQ